WPRLTSEYASEDLSISVALTGTHSDLPGYRALSFTLMPVGSTPHRSVQVPGFDDLGHLTPVRRLYPLPVRQASALPPASFRRPVARNALAVQLALPLAGYAEDFHLQESAPCRAHQARTPQPVGRFVHCTKTQPVASA